MIAYLKGEIINKSDNYLIINVNNIGYQVYVTSHMLREININCEYEIYTYQNVREDSLTLFGFKNINERKVFESLIYVSGVGPRSGLAFFEEYSVDQIVSAIGAGDTAAINKVSGIGKKTAEKVILELKDKIVKLFPDVKINKTASGEIISSGIGIEEGFKSELIQALSSLGYNNREIEQAISKNNQQLMDAKSVEDGIRILLKNLG